MIAQNFKLMRVQIHSMTRLNCKAIDIDTSININHKQSKAKQSKATSWSIYIHFLRPDLIKQPQDCKLNYLKESLAFKTADF